MRIVKHGPIPWHHAACFQQLCLMQCHSPPATCCRCTAGGRGVCGWQLSSAGLHSEAPSQRGCDVEPRRLVLLAWGSGLLALVCDAATHSSRPLVPYLALALRVEKLFAPHSQGAHLASPVTTHDTHLTHVGCPVSPTHLLLQLCSLPPRRTLHSTWSIVSGLLPTCASPHLQACASFTPSYVAVPAGLSTFT